ncbi:Pep3/Vps18/deep orange family-domain-containing protein [Gloeopeniophorella convolvens]|nr:Pep3/Vps18/deep orange family-domain-containing protein [Gloeopeniophorella convolvens]
MFDDYVEHATTTTGGLLDGAGPLPPLQYEGFEPSPYGSQDAGGNEPNMDVNQHTGTPNALAPIFDLGRVQYSLPAPLVSLVVASDVLAMGLSSNVIVLIELAHSDQVVKTPIPRKPTEFSMYKIFMDPSGRHLIITSLEGENWYLFRGWKKPKQLKSFKMVIESVAWNKAALLSSSHLTSTREILIGARNGTIYEAALDAEEDFFKSQERYLNPVFSLPERQAITGINFDFFPPIDPKKVLIVVITTSRIYQFVGVPPRRPDDGGRVFGAIFATYRDTAPKISELPGNIRHSELHYYTPNSGQSHSLPREVAWMTSPGVFHGTLNFQSTSDDFIDGAQLLPYPSFSASPSVASQQSAAADFPVSVALTEFHLVLLYSDRIAAISLLDENLTYEEVLPLKHGEVVRALTADPVRKTYWVYTDQSLFELIVGNEDRDVWKINLQKERFDVALQYAKTAGQRDLVFSSQAHALFNAKRYFPAAKAYAQCSVSFEDVVLKFLDANERDALREYLMLRLEQTRKSDLTQRMMLATWLVEFYLSKCDELDDLIASSSALYDVENVKTERTILEEDIRHFLESHKDDLEPNTIYELIQNHGRTDMYLFYATLIGHFERVVEHWVLEEDWVKVIDAISRQSSLDLYYRFASVLMSHAPRETVDSWIRQPALDPLRLVPAILQFQSAPRDPLSPNQAIRYLNHVVFEQLNTSSTLHNLVITLHASPTAGSSEDDGPLLRFLATAPVDPLTGKPYYDLDYALRLCSEAGRTQPCVHIYSQMGLWESSVDLALEKGDLELAKLNADKPEDDPQLRKKLWLKIAKFVVQDKKDIKMAMRFLESTDLLKIEDILPFFPDFVVIDDFKEEIANALESYSAQIEELKNEMDDATRSADSMKESIAGLKNRFITIDAGEKCSVCSLPILTRQFYVFPCHHAFHADCLVGLTKEYLPAHALRRLLALQDEIVKGKAGADQGDAAYMDGNPTSRPPGSQRALLSQNFAPPAQNGHRQTNSIGRNILSAGDRLRDLIIPDALVTVITSPAGWIPGIGGGQKNALTEVGAGKRIEKLKSELEDILASACPLCESVIVGLDKSFIKGESDVTWEL